jgi:hypothetical protein
MIKNSSFFILNDVMIFNFAAQDKNLLHCFI